MSDYKTNPDQKKDDNAVNEKSSDLECKKSIDSEGEIEIYSEDDPDMPDYMKELSELVNQKK